MAAPCVPARSAMPMGILNARTAMTRDVMSEMIAHQWVATLNTPMRTKKRMEGEEADDGRQEDVARDGRRRRGKGLS